MANLPVTIFFRQEVETLWEAIASSVNDLVQGLVDRNTEGPDEAIQSALSDIDGKSKQVTKIIRDYREFLKKQTVPKGGSAGSGTAEWAI